MSCLMLFFGQVVLDDLREHIEQGMGYKTWVLKMMDHNLQDEMNPYLSKLILVISNRWGASTCQLLTCSVRNGKNLIICFFLIHISLNIKAMISISATFASCLHYRNKALSSFLCFLCPLFLGFSESFCVSWFPEDDLFRLMDTWSSCIWTELYTLASAVLLTW